MSASTSGIMEGAMHKNLRLALDYASHHDYEDGLEYELCALIVRGGSILSVGYNKRATNGFVEYYADQARGVRNYCLSTHAEMAAVLKARNKSDLSGAKIFIVRRRKKDGKLALARPCVICQHVLYNYGIRRAVYSIDERSYGVMKMVNPASLKDEGNGDDNIESIVSVE